MTVLFDYDDDDDDDEDDEDASSSIFSFSVRICWFEQPLRTIPHNQGEGDHCVDSIHRKTDQEEPIFVCDEIV